MEEHEQARVTIAQREDRELSKQVVVRGTSGSQPREGARCEVRLCNVQVCAESSPAPHAPDPHSRYFAAGFDGRLTLGEADSFLDADLERCLFTMCCGETSLVELTYRDRAGRMMLRVSCELRLLRAEQRELLCDWQHGELVAQARRHKERGVELVKEKRIADAFRKFAHAHRLLVATEPVDVSELTEEEMNETVELKVKLLNNVAHCQLHFHQYEPALTVCEKLLKLRPDDPKALYRRSVARMGLEMWEAAWNDMQAVLKREPGNKDALQKASIIKPKIDRINAEYNNMVKKMFG